MAAFNGRYSRRGILRGAGATAIGLASPAVWTGERAFGADEITVADVGGAPGAAIRKAFCDPFEQATGIRAASVAHDADPTTQFKLLVDTHTFIWDLCMVTPAHVGYLSKPKDYLEPLNIGADEVSDLVPGALTPVWFGFSVFATLLAYRTDKFGDNGPNNWADFWNIEKFPGRRALYKGVAGMLESALMADGVPAAKLYPLDVDRAFRMLDKIKSHVNVWWTSGAQNTQILQSGEVPEQQAIYSNTVANAPTNQKAYDFIKPERAKVLATYPENLKGLAPTDDVWWAQNRSKVVERFQDWLLS